MVNHKYVDKVVLVKLQNNKRPTYRWIVRRRDDGRYIARAPKIGILLINLNKKLNKDYNSEHLLPKTFSFWKRLSKKGPQRLKRSKRSKKK